MVERNSALGAFADCEYLKTGAKDFGNLKQLLLNADMRIDLPN